MSGGLRGAPALLPIRRAVHRFEERRRPLPHSGCHAPSVQLYFFPDGAVRACCLNVTHDLGNVTRERLLDIWNGEPRRQLTERLAADDFSLGCSGCAWEIETEGRPGSFAASFDSRAQHLRPGGAGGEWPRWMEFNLSNACNLQCVQCVGELSSSIRIHRERKPPLAKAYHDQFFEDLRLFLPHLEEAQFAGGEPFLGAENYRVWDLLAEIAPDVRVRVVTNATQWNKRVEQALELLPFSITFSIDGITRQTYESIREGADFEQMMANVERFCSYADERGTALALNFCLMRDNHHELGDILAFADERGMDVNIQVVHTPPVHSLATLPRDELARVHAELLAQDDAVMARLDRNAHVWRRELARIESWLAAGADADDHAAAFQPELAVPVALSTGPPVEWLAGLPRQAEGPYGAEGAIDVVALHSADGRAHVITVDAEDTIVDCSPQAPEALGCEREALVGRPLAALDAAVEAWCGPRSSVAVLESSEHHIDVLSVYGDQEFRAVTVALRDDSGRADRAQIVFSAKPVLADPLAARP